MKLIKINLFGLFIIALLCIAKQGKAQLTSQDQALFTQKSNALLSTSDPWQVTTNGIYYSGGRVGIGTMFPSTSLDVLSTINVSDGGSNRDLRLSLNSKVALCSFNTQTTPNDILYINRNWNSSYYSDYSTVAIYGNVGIGTNSPTEQLHVAGNIRVTGTIRANEIRVTSGGADFVFAPDYRLPPLTEVEQFITANKHLPDIAPADSMVQNGVNMGEMQIKLLQKIEELTLYVIELKKENEMQQKEIEKLKENK